MKKIDTERIIELISIIKENLEFIKEEDIKTVETLKESKKTYFAVSMALFTTLNKVLELGEEAIDSLDKNIYPKSYREIPKILFQEKIINKKLYTSLSSLIKYRNDIAHEYEQIFENEIFWCIKEINSIEEFIKIIKKNILNFV